MRPVANQLVVQRLVTQDLKLSERSLAGAGSGFEQCPAESLGHREDAWREPRRVFKSVTGAVLGPASRPNGRTSVRSAWTRMTLRTPHKATRNSITRDQIMTGSGRGFDASQSVGETGGCAVLEGVSCREFFRIGRIGNLWYKFPRECARRAGKGRVRQFAHANRTLKRGCRDG
jgi:hypothetical protein